MSQGQLTSVFLQKPIKLRIVKGLSLMGSGITCDDTQCPQVRNTLADQTRQKSL